MARRLICLAQRNSGTLLADALGGVSLFGMLIGGLFVLPF
jgi:hypothetical protein